MKIRLFVAIDCPSKTKEEINHLVRKLKSKYPKIRWEKRENLHLTLKFLGWVEIKLKTKNEKVKTQIKNNKIEEITEGIKRSVSGIKPFWFEPSDLGYFLRQSLIVWLAVKSQEGLFQIAKNLEKEMAKLGFRKERRKFSPHITLGRARKIKPRKKWQRIAQEIKNFPTRGFSKFQVSEITLMKSRLTPKGSTYSVINRVFLE